LTGQGHFGSTDSHTVKANLGPALLVGGDFFEHLELDRRGKFVPQATQWYAACFLHEDILGRNRIVGRRTPRKNFGDWSTEDVSHLSNVNTS
jgi:hypothetical protein